jgi:alcohol dehydrogenase (NADP+)
MQNMNNQTRRKFIQQASLVGAGVLIANPIQLFSQTNKSNTMSKNINSRGYAGKDEQGTLVSWNFERRPVGDNDILIDVKFSGICHSDIHTIKGHWGKQQYPQVTGSRNCRNCVSSRKKCK